MKEIKRTEIKKVLVNEPRYIDKEVEVVIYESEDGLKYDNEMDCKEHEEYVQFKKSLKPLCLSDFPLLPEVGTLYYFKCKEDFDRLCKTLRGDKTFKDNIKTFPQSVLIEHLYNGDYPDSFHFSSEEEIKKMVENANKILKYILLKGEDYESN